MRMSMKIKANELAEIHEYGSTKFFVGKIISHVGDYIYYKNVSVSGSYSGFAMISLRGVSNIHYSTSYLQFYKAILIDDQDYYYFDNPYDLILYCYKNNEIIEISKFTWDDYVYNLKIIEINDDYFIGQKVSDSGKLSTTIKIKFKDIYYVVFGTSLLKNYKKYLESQK